MAGRPTKYTEEIATAICLAVATGVPEVLAAQAAGIGKSTLTDWKRNRQPFSEAVKRARAEAVQRRVERIEKAARGGEEYETQEKVVKHKDGKIEKTVIRKKTVPVWQADAWYLERQFCEQFGLNRLDLKELLALLRESKRQRKEESA